MMQVEICKCCGKPKKKVIGSKLGRPGMAKDGSNQRNGFDSAFGGESSGIMSSDITSPATPAAAEWDGWGTALKPAWEPILVARKPLQGTVAENVQRYGTGAINVDACRIETGEYLGRPVGKPNNAYEWSRHDNPMKGQITSEPQGRWPANLIHDGSAEVLAGFPMTMQNGYRMNPSFADSSDSITGWNHGMRGERGYTDTGSAARFFYCAKASKQDRDEGLEDYELQDCGMMEDDNYPIKTGSGNLRETKRHNGHPTVKPTSLMRYLCRLVTPPAGVILDPFMGSGSTGKAAILEGFNFVGVDTEIEYVEIAARRIEHACGKVGIVIEQPMMFDSKREMVDRPKQLILL